MALSPDLVDETKFLPLLQALHACVDAELTAAGGPSLCFSGIVLGSSPPPLGLMDCTKQCGVLWIRPVSAFESNPFPQPTIGLDASRCTNPLAMEVEIGIARCYPRPSGTAMYPDPQAVFEAVRLGMSDFKAIRKAITCCFNTSDREVALGAWTPLEAAMGAAGGTWQAWIG